MNHTNGAAKAEEPNRELENLRPGIEEQWLASCNSFGARVREDTNLVVEVEDALISCVFLYFSVGVVKKFVLGLGLYRLSFTKV